MHFVILGAGGVGSVVGAHLAKAGHRVALIGRTAHVDAIRSHGLRLTGVLDFEVWPEAYVSAAELSGADVLLLTTKAADTEEALKSAAHLDIGIAASLQNGVAKNEQLAQVFGRGRVIGGAIAVGARLREPGVVEQNRQAGVLFGELDGGASERLGSLVHAFDETSIEVSAVENIVACEQSR